MGSGKEALSSSVNLLGLVAESEMTDGITLVCTSLPWDPDVFVMYLRLRRWCCLLRVLF